MKHTTMLVSAVLAGAALTAPADLLQVDSSQFDYKYEMKQLITNEDVDGNETVDFTKNGTFIDSTTEEGVSATFSANNYYISNANGGAWRVFAPAESDGYTIELCMKVITQTGSGFSVALQASTADSNCDAQLNFRTGQVMWDYSLVKKMDTTDDFHTYRIAKLPGENKFYVWCDGTQAKNEENEYYGDGLTAYGKLNRLLFGAIGGAYGGKVEIRYLRFTKGAYAPISGDKRKASTEFKTKYEMDANDPRILPDTSASDWTINGASGAIISKDSGILSVNPNGKQTFWTTTDSAWKNEVTANTAFTVDFSLKINTCVQDNGDRTLLIWCASPRATGVLLVGKNHTYWQTTQSMNDNILLDESDNHSSKHVFRISYNGATKNGFTVWRDGVKIGDMLPYNPNFTKPAYNFISFGRRGTTINGAFDIDYIRWDTTGAYDWKDPPKGFTMVIR